MNTVGKLLMTCAIAIYAFIPPLVDLLTDTHVFHEGWMPHARMHTVWLLGVTSGVGCISLYFLWSSKIQSPDGITLAGTLSAVVYGAFFLSAATTAFYGGSLSDQSGGVASGPLGIDANVFTFGVASVMLGLGWRLAGRGRTA